MLLFSGVRHACLLELERRLDFIDSHNVSLQTTYTTTNGHGPVNTSNVEFNSAPDAADPES